MLSIVYLLYIKLYAFFRKRKFRKGGWIFCSQLAAAFLFDDCIYALQHLTLNKVNIG